MWWAMLAHRAALSGFLTLDKSSTKHQSDLSGSWVIAASPNAPRDGLVPVLLGVFPNLIAGSAVGQLCHRLALQPLTSLRASQRRETSVGQEPTLSGAVCPGKLGGGSCELRHMKPCRSQPELAWSPPAQRSGGANIHLPAPVHGDVPLGRSKRRTELLGRVVRCLSPEAFSLAQGLSRATLLRGLFP